MESLSRYLLYVESSKLIHGIKVTKDAPSISHLFFADDCLIFSNASHEEADNLMSLIHDFGACSGQVINLQKSGSYFSKNCNPDFCVSLIRQLKIKKIDLKEKYLGIPLFIGRSNNETFDNLSHHFDKRAVKWKGKHFTQSGRSVMVQHVLQSSPLYQMNIFLLPDDTIHKMEKSQRDFWWGKNHPGGNYPIAWDGIFCPKLQGGLGFKNLKHFNLALLAKTAWNLIQHSNDL